MFEQIRANQRNAAILVIVMAFLLVALGFALGEMLGSGGGVLGVLAAVGIWCVMTLVSYFSGDKILLSIAGARKIDRSDHPVLFNVVEEMCIASGLAKLPDIYIIDDDSPNAFATGRDKKTAVVAVTSGLLKALDRNELQGVIAHEIGHVNNRDILYMMMIGIMMGTIVILADFGRRFLFYGGGSRTRSRRSGGAAQIQIVVIVVAIALMILAPIIAQLIYLALSRKREYLADACSAQYTRYPEGLASALEKIGKAAIPLRVASQATAPMYIVNPMKFTDVTSTHPPLSERIRILRSIGAGGTLAGYDEAFRKVTGRPVG
ncbi:MAG TPA: M48 family metallopeptidase, partial [Thermoanaerobaculia bacterium]